MKKLRSFLGSMFSDHGRFDHPYTDAQSIMYSYITFSGAPRKNGTTHKPCPDNIINFNDFKLRRA